MQAPKVLFVILDGGRARFVKRVEPRRALATVLEVDGSRRLRDSHAAARGRPATRTFHGPGSASHAPADSEPERRAKESFLADVAALTPHVLREQSLDTVFVVAPGRLLRQFQDLLPAQVRVAGALARDLTKTPDADLAKWLHPLPGPAQIDAG